MPHHSVSGRRDLFKARMSYKITVPHPPKLRTAARHRPSFLPTQEDREQKEIEEMKKYSSYLINVTCSTLLTLFVMLKVSLNYNYTVKKGSQHQSGNLCGNCN